MVLIGEVISLSIESVSGRFDVLSLLWRKLISLYINDIYDIYGEFCVLYVKLDLSMKRMIIKILYLIYGFVKKMGGNYFGLLIFGFDVFIEIFEY